MKKYLLMSFSMIGQIGFVVAIPMVGLGLLGRYFDTRFATKPYLFLLCLAIATAIAYLSVKLIVLKLIKEMNKNGN